MDDMDAPTFPYTDAQLQEAGLLGDGESFCHAFLRYSVIRPFRPSLPYTIYAITHLLPKDASELVRHVLQTMRDHPGMLSESSTFSSRLYRTYHTVYFRPELSLFALQCINKTGHECEAAASASKTPALPTSDMTTPVSKYNLDEYEQKSYYYGLAGETDHPDLPYRSDYNTTPYPRTHRPVKSARGVFDTPLNDVWDTTVGPKISDIFKARQIQWTSVGLVRWYTHGEGEEEKGSLGPVVIWVGVPPASTSADTAHEVSEEILTVLKENGVNDAVVEWREAVLQRL